MTYRFAQDAKEQEILGRFSLLLELARAMELDWGPRAGVRLGVLFRELEQQEQAAQMLPALQECFFFQQVQNVRATLMQITKSVGQAEVPGLVRWQLPCFLQELREEWYFWACVHPFPERWAEYYEREFAEHHKNTLGNPEQKKYEVSIFVPAKDKLEYTQRCVESILRETDREEISYELILINHGSRDGTQDYFESIPGAKLLHFEENVRMMMFSSALRVCEGQYMAFVSNDTVVTKDWLSLLLRCIRSDSNIISATPITPNISNFQAIPEAYNNMEEMARFAAGYNHHDPAEWEQRARVLPVIALYDIEKVNAIGFGDRYFRTMEFWDDDFSLRARRAGYRQLLCRNVFCHHFGSVTGREAQIKENTLQKGRALFVAKHGADPWENGAYYDYPLCTRLQGLEQPAGQQAAALGIDAGFGDTLLQIGNILRKSGKTLAIDCITTEPQYAEDLRVISRSFRLAKHEYELLELLQQDFGNEGYDYIYLARPLERYREWKGLLGALLQKLKPGGWLLFSLSNLLDVGNVQWFSGLALPPGKEQFLYLNPDRVSVYLHQQSNMVITERKRGWAPASLLSQLANQYPHSKLPPDMLALVLDTIGFTYYARKPLPELEQAE